MSHYQVAVDQNKYRRLRLHYNVIIIKIQEQSQWNIYHQPVPTRYPTAHHKRSMYSQVNSSQLMYPVSFETLGATSIRQNTN